MAAHPEFVATNIDDHTTGPAVLYAALGDIEANSFTGPRHPLPRAVPAHQLLYSTAGR